MHHKVCLSQNTLFYFPPRDKSHNAATAQVCSHVYYTLPIVFIQNLTCVFTWSVVLQKSLKKKTWPGLLHSLI